MVSSLLLVFGPFETVGALIGFRSLLSRAGLEAPASIALDDVEESVTMAIAIKQGKQGNRR